MESIDFFNSNNNNTFNGKNILVTGATGGIGRIITESLAKLGANVIATSRSERKVIETFPKLVNKNNFDKEIMNFDSPKSINRGFQSIVTKFNGKLDIVIITHALFKPGGLMDSNINDFDEVLNINVRSCFHLISLATPFLKLSKGNVVVLSSEEGSIITADSFLNSLSKSMLNSLIQNSALELSSFGIRVNGVAPGITNTDFRVTDEFSRKDNQIFFERMSEVFLLNKSVIEPEDVANSVLFLASEEAKFITGEIITVDNGYSLNHDLSFSTPA